MYLLLNNIKTIIILSSNLIINNLLYNINIPEINNITMSVITEYNCINYKYIVIKWLLTASIIINIMQYINLINDNNLYKTKKYQTTNTN
jgi:hypothetical protein